MRPTSLKHLLTKPALLIAAGLVLLGAAAGRAAPATLGGLATAEDGVGTGASCRVTRPSLDALCRCLGASLALDEDGSFAHVGLHAAFEPSRIRAVEAGCVCAGREVCELPVPRTRLRQCVVGPSPPAVV